MELKVTGGGEAVAREGRINAPQYTLQGGAYVHVSQRLRAAGGPPDYLVCSGPALHLSSKVGAPSLLARLYEAAW